MERKVLRKICIESLLSAREVHRGNYGLAVIFGKERELIESNVFFKICIESIYTFTKRGSQGVLWIGYNLEKDREI